MNGGARKVVGIAVALALSAVAGCVGRPAPKPQPPPVTTTIRQAGDEDMWELSIALGTAFSAGHPSIQVNAQGGGVAAAIKGLISGTIDIANSTRPLTPAELGQAKAAGVNPVAHLIGYDGMVVVVHPWNPLTTIPMKTLSDIFSGKTKTWAAVGAPDLGSIQVFTREPSSAAYELFKRVVVTLDGTYKDRNYTRAASPLDSSETMMCLVAEAPGGIGYLRAALATGGVKPLAIVPLKGGAPLIPAADAVRNGTYPLARKLYCYTNGEPQGALKDYLDFIAGEQGQTVVGDSGFIPVRG